MIATSRRRNLAIIVGLLIGTALFWRWWTRQPAPEWEFDCGGAKPVVSVSADGQFLAVGASRDGPPIAILGGKRQTLRGLIQVWNIAERKVVASCTTAEAVKSLAFTTDGSCIFAATNDMWHDVSSQQRRRNDHGSLLTWNFHGQERPIEVALPDSVQSAAISPDDKYVAAILGGDKGVEEMRLRPKLCVASFDALLRGKLETVDMPTKMTIQVLGWCTAFLRQNQLIVAIKDEQHAGSTLEIWDIDSRKRAAASEYGFDNPNDIAVSPDETAIAVLNGLTLSGVVDLQSMQVSAPPGICEWPVTIAFTLRYHPSGELIAVAGESKDSYFNLHKGGFALYHLPRWEVAGWIFLSELRTVIRSIAFTPDGESLITASDDGSIRLWSVQKIQNR